MSDAGGGPPYTAAQLVFTSWGPNPNGIGQDVIITLAPPPGASFSGNCGEWILETPTVNGTIIALPQFTPVQFTSAYCHYTPTSTSADPANGDIFNLTTGTDAVAVADLGTNAVTIQYELAVE